MKLLAKSITLVLAAAFTGCTSDDAPEITYPESGPVSSSDEALEITYPESGPVSLIQKAIESGVDLNTSTKNLPGWLSEYIDDRGPDNIRDVAAFQGKWKGKDVYYVFDAFSSCFMCATFWSDGGKVNWSEYDEKDIYEFWESSTDWKCIYLSKAKYHDIR